MPFFRIGAVGAALALTGLAVLGLPTPANADHRCPNPPGHYPPGQCDVSNDNAGGVSDTTPVPGEKAAVQSKGHKPGSSATIHAESTPILLGTCVAGSSGVVNTLVTIPASLSVGAHSIVVRGVAPSGLPLENRFPITITAANKAAAQGGAGAGAGSGAGAGAGGSAGGGTGVSVGGVQLPRTGGEIVAVTAVGVALVGLGGAALYAGRRRRNGTPVAG